ncbi:CpaF family protein [Methanobrevibacter filiformis]|uniref:Putative conjugal transfer proteinc n=1 Tax=Methanobrevibacter filiformis TaxID=55758 RepID=A0A165YZT1_9EURY|nr:CpaF family protein [Methanobrevibacter filiformis]KZX10071.1 putative conjugal transfer proteinc [Methanobrevibacter filiformis]
MILDNENNEISVIPLYEIARPKFSKREKNLLEELRTNLIDQAISLKQEFKIDKYDILDNIKNFLKFRFETIDSNYLDKLANSFYQEIFGYGKIDPLIKDNNLEEIMVIGVNKPIFVYHRQYGMMETNLNFKEEKSIMSLIDSIARQINRRIDQQSPILDARLPDGSRVNATIPPISAEGPSITIRKFNEEPLSIVDLIKSKTLNSDLASFLWVCIDGLGVNPANIIISGGTSSGKTTTLNALSSMINPRERIISIEDTLELQIYHKHLLKMETRPKNIENSGEVTMDDLVKNSLRQRPDRIIVGEVRGSEAITLFTALNTGHSGFGTLHANNSRETITRLINHPMDVPKIMISAIDLIIMQNRIHRPDGGSIRRISEVSEVVGMEEDTIQLNKIFNWNPKTDEIEDISISSNTLKNLSEFKGISIDEIKEEIQKRKFILDFGVKNNINSNKELNTLFEQYYLVPDELIEYIQELQS